MTGELDGASGGEGGLNSLPLLRGSVEFDGV